MMPEFDKPEEFLAGLLGDTSVGFHRVGTRSAFSAVVPRLASIAVSQGVRETAVDELRHQMATSSRVRLRISMVIVRRDWAEITPGGETQVAADWTRSVASQANRRPGLQPITERTELRMIANPS